MPRLGTVLLALATLTTALPARAGTKCEDVLARIGGRLADVSCVESPDLTTANLATTTPANNSIPGLPAFAFTPVTDRGVISPNPPDRTPITKAVPGVQLDARLADDPTGEARFLLRLPDDWNGSLVVAGASGTRSEFNGDFSWSDYVVQKGFAYASQNKGVLNLFLSNAADPLGCRLNPSSRVFVHFYDNDPEKPFTEWQDRIVEAARIAKDGVKGRYGHTPRHTYAVGTSNGGYQVRRAVEEAPDLFDGGVDWEGTFVDGAPPNLLTDLPPAVENFPEYVASGFDPDSTAAHNIQEAGYPPDIVRSGVSLWGLYNSAFWEVTFCQWQKRLDPSYDTYVSGAGAYPYATRRAITDVEDNFAAFATTGKIKVPLITVAGTMDALLPIKNHARAYAAKVADSRRGNDARRQSQFRLYEVQNGNHIETFKGTFPQLEFIQPHAQKAFDLLVDHVERGATLPPDQCIARGGTISGSPAGAGRCKELFVP